MIDRAMGSAEGLTTTRTSESATVAPPGMIEAIADSDRGGLFCETLLVGAAETLHGDWTCSLVGLVTQKMGFESYHMNDLQCARQH